jgi:hypothetical protein
MTTKPRRECVDCGCTIPPPAIGAGNSGAVCIWCLMKRRDKWFAQPGEAVGEGEG